MVVEKGTNGCRYSKSYNVCCRNDGSPPIWRLGVGSQEEVDRKWRHRRTIRIISHYTCHFARGESGMRNITQKTHKSVLSSQWLDYLYLIYTSYIIWHVAMAPGGVSLIGSELLHRKIWIQLSQQRYRSTCEGWIFLSRACRLVGKLYKYIVSGSVIQ